MPARDIQCHRFHLNGNTSLQCYMLLSAVLLPLCLYVFAVTFTYHSGAAQRDSWLVTRLPPRPHLALRPATNITSRFPIASHQRPCTSRHTSVLHTLANIVRNIERWQRIDSSNYPKDSELYSPKLPLAKPYDTDWRSQQDLSVCFWRQTIYHIGMDGVSSLAYGHYRITSPHFV